MSTFGQELRRERELREISLREVAEETKINVRYLEAMERNQFELLPGGVFTRGFVRAYCKAIGLDPDQMVDAYLLEEQTRDGGSGTDPRLLRGSVNETREKSAAARRSAWPWVALVVAAVAGLALLYYAFGALNG